MPAQSIGNTLIDIFVEAGIKRIYGVPGDYNLRFLELLESDGRIEFIGTCNELNACYAADGDARISGFAVVTVTYGVGDLGLLSAIAGAYAENVPVLVLSGAPPEYASRSGALLHHTLADGNYTNVLKAFEQFTSAQSTLTAQNAGTELLRLIKVAWTMKLPVYAQLPSDIVDAPSERNTPTPNYCFPSSDKTILSNVINFFVHRLERAHSPVILIDALADRYGVVSDILRIIEKWSLPYAVMPTAKGTCPEDSSLYLGVYFGQKSRNGLFELIGQSDLVIGIGVRFVDSTSAWFSQRIRADAWVNIEATQVVSFKQSFENVEITELVSTWLKWDTDRHPRSTNFSQSVSIKPQVNIVWGQHYFWSQIEAFIEPHDIIIADNGTSLAGVNALNLPEGCSIVSQPIWGAIGYTCPALLGTLLAAPHRRQLLFIGDGAFQLTGQEISTMLRRGAAPIIFLINNRGYTIERMILGPNAHFNDIAAWSYEDLLHGFGGKECGKFIKVGDISGLQKVLQNPSNGDRLLLIEVSFDPLDGPPGLSEFGKMARDYDYPTSYGMSSVKS